MTAIKNKIYIAMAAYLTMSTVRRPSCVEVEFLVAVIALELQN